jgi:hypothetical protein
MHKGAKAETLRLLLRTATGLRAVAAQTLDAEETDLFLRGALILEARAHALADNVNYPVPDIHAQIDLTC